MGMLKILVFCVSSISFALAQRLCFMHLSMDYSLEMNLVYGQADDCAKITIEKVIHRVVS